MATVIIAGPTSAGKSQAAIDIAREFDCPVISADARQCYKYLDIGTGKVPAEILEEIPHYNISIFEPDEPDTAADFANRCKDWSGEILQSSELCLYAGGSTLHLESILYPFDDIPDANPENVSKLEEEADTFGVEHLFKKLKNVDPVYSKKMDGFNRHRIIRALDVWMQTGEPFSSFHHKNKTNPDADLIFILSPERQTLHERINNRVDEMLNEGFVQEVKSILEMGFSPEIQSLKTVGYREVIAYLNGELDYPNMVEKIKTQTRRYAKRQITWFRRWPDAVWIDSGQSRDKIKKELISYIKPLIKNP